MHEDAPTMAEFFQNFDLFRESLFAGILGGFVLGWIGVYVVMRRMVFVTATVSQASALGIATAFYASIHLGIGEYPVAGALLFALAAAYAFSLDSLRNLAAREGVLGLMYIAASAAAILVGQHITQEAHDITGILFGTAVLVDPADFRMLLGASAVVLVLHLVLARGFVFAGFDPEGARVQGVPVRLLDTVLWVTLAFEVSAATRALGALPVFAFAVVPAMAGLLVARRIRVALLVASVSGGLSGGLGYVLAYLENWTVGASQAVVSLAVLSMVALVVGISSRVRRRGAR